MKANKKLSKIKGAQFYKVGDKVETIKNDTGAWFSADIIDISPKQKCECVEECRCTYKLVFDGDGNDELQVVDRKLNEIRQVTYSSIDWDKLQVGMKVVINYNIEKPKQWGYWYDYIIEDLQKRDNVIYLKGTLLVGHEGRKRRIPVKIDSDNVADVLEIRPHATLREKEMDGYETGIKPEYCKKCRNKPKVRCKTCCCCKCGTKKDFELTVQCDECDEWYHIYCLSPPLEKIPNDEDWYCPKCNNETHRAKVELKQKLKKQKQKEKCQNLSSKNNATGKKSPESIPKSLNVQEKIPSPEEEDVEMEEIIQEIPKNSSIWTAVEEQYAGYELLRVVAELVRVKDGGIIDAALEECIAKDVENNHLWQEAKRSAAKGKQAFLDAVRRIFTCAICCELMDDPITLSCKHSFCIDCFFRSLSVNVYNCALCRVDVIHTQHYVVNENLKKALAILFDRKLSKRIDA